MTIPEVELQIVRGSAKSWPFQVVVEAIAAGSAGGGPAITGASLWFTVKDDYEDTDANAIMQFIVGTGITISSASEVTVAASWNTAALAAVPRVKTTLRWDLRIRYADGSGPYTLVRGPLVVHPNVTRLPNE